MLAAARAEAEVIAREAAVEAQEAAQRLRAEVDAEIRARRLELERQAAELAARAAAADRRAQEIEGQRAEIAERGAADRASGSRRRRRPSAAAARAAGGAGPARAGGRAVGGGGAQAAGGRGARGGAAGGGGGDPAHRGRGAGAAADRARALVAAAVQRQASEYVIERTVAVVPLPSDDMKGRIIGREGRNIRALEAATGVDIIIDDTPEAVVISCFHPVRREIARLALTRLIADGRIHPSRIEEMVEKATAEVDHQGQEAAEQAAFDLGIGRLHPELLRLVGRLKFASSQAQNLLQHSIEVGFLAGAMAAELGLPVKLARRAGLLHDIGRAADHEIEGSHAAVGALLARKHGEEAAICQAIETHHGDVPASEALDHLRRCRQRHLRAAAGGPARDARDLRAAARRPGAHRHQLRGRGEGLRHPGRPRGARAGGELPGLRRRGPGAVPGASPAGWRPSWPTPARSGWRWCARPAPPTTPSSPAGQGAARVRRRWNRRGAAFPVRLAHPCRRLAAPTRRPRC